MRGEARGVRVSGRGISGPARGGERRGAGECWKKKRGRVQAERLEGGERRRKHGERERTRRRKSTEACDNKV